MDQTQIGLEKSFIELRRLLNEGLAHHAYALSSVLVEKFPENDRAQLNHAVVCIAKNEPIEAIKHATQAYQLNNEHKMAHKLVAKAYFALDEFSEALKFSEHYINDNPEDPEAYLLSGIAFYKLRYLHDAENRLNSALSFNELKDKIKADCLIHLGMTLSGIDGRSDEAEVAARAAVEIFPETASYHMEFGNILSLRSKESEAIQHFDWALELNPHLGSAYWNKSRSRKIGPNDLPFIETMKSLYLSEGLAPRDQTLIGFSLAKALNDLGNYEGAVDCWITANRVQRKSEGFNISVEKLQFARYYSEVPKGVPPEMRFDAETEPQPIFILGMPRSGTTLTEQIIGAHSRVTPLGELEYMSRSVEMARREFGAPTSPEAIQFIRTMYLAFLAPHRSSTSIITDKMPLNFRFIPIIAHAFPEARIIHCRRDARAVCFSNFSTHFPAKGLVYSCDQQDVAEFYKLYHDFMLHTENQFGPRIYNLDYEQLTENQEEKTKCLLNYCGLEFERACLEFHNSDRAITTASQRQVKRGMYKGSSDRWRRYEPWLGEMIATLEKHGL
ncbi:MAG: sulfotransferase [Rhodobacteraceae bacterium]|nr:sulfotransferase [Paracoccaceae bacterium]